MTDRVSSLDVAGGSTSDLGSEPGGSKRVCSDTSGGREPESTIAIHHVQCGAGEWTRCSAPIPRNERYRAKNVQLIFVLLRVFIALSRRLCAIQLCRW